MRSYLFFSTIILNICYLIKCKLISEILKETRYLLTDNAREIFDKNQKSFNLLNKLEQKILKINNIYNLSLKKDLLPNNNTIRIVKKDKELNEIFQNDFDFIMDNSMFNPLLFQGDILLMDNQVEKIIYDLKKQIDDKDKEISKLTINTTQKIITTTVKLMESTEKIDTERTTENNAIRNDTITGITLSPNKDELGNIETATKEDEYNYSNEKNQDTIVRVKKNTNTEIFKWKLPISYYIDSSINSNNVEKAIKLFHKNTCIRFIKKYKFINNTEGINFYPGPGCWSYIGLIKKNNSQEISLGKDCDKSIPIIQHEIGHALGLIHQESYSERDHINTINNSNIIRNMEGHLAISNYSNTLNFKFNYDYGSSMHFNDSKLTNKYQQIIIPRISQYNRMKTFNRTFNFNDYKILNYYYCNGKCPNKINNCKYNGYQDPNNCFMCKCPEPFSGKFCNTISHSIGPCGRKILFANNGKKAIYKKGYSKCTYQIISKKLKKINLLLTELQNEAPEPCLEGTGLEIKYQSNKGITGLCLCGKHKNISLSSDDNIVVIKYFGKKLSDYFRLEYVEDNQ
uniref:Metalloendopeptidase n=1 Tax=Strongyloides stercoralis TaxID=6248 RepID=A0AAF5D2I5_STRER